MLQWLGPVQHAALVTPAEHHAAAPHQPAEPPRPLVLVAPPDPALLERSAAFAPAQLPRIAADGRAPRAVYAARPVPVPAGAARIALLVSGVGRAERDTQAAIDTLPGPVSFAISAYAALSPATLNAARAAGHELFASLPMEPQGYPLNDEGPKSMLTGATPANNRANLEWALSRVDGAVGTTGASDGMRGERFADMAGAMDPVLEEVARRGLLYVDPRPGAAVSRPNLLARTVDVVVDEPFARAEIEAKLASLERIAKEKGSALGLSGRIQPVTLERLAAWSKDLSRRGFVLVPVSQLMQAPP